MSDHGSDGKFVPGNKAAAGRKSLARLTEEFRAALVEATTPEQAAVLMRHLFSVALKSRKANEVAAVAKVYFDRVVGPPIAVDIVERLERLEQELLDREA